MYLVRCSKTFVKVIVSLFTIPLHLMPHQEHMLIMAVSFRDCPLCAGYNRLQPISTDNGAYSKQKDV